MLLRGESTRPVDMLLSRLRTCESQPLETTVLPVATPEAVQQIRMISAESASTLAAQSGERRRPNSYPPHCKMQKYSSPGAIAQERQSQTGVTFFLPALTL